MSPLNFSVVLIARNEVKTLPRLIRSLEEFKSRGGEIILLDTGSSDGTPALARDLGCKVTEVGEKFITVIDRTMASRINFKFVVGREAPIVKEGDKLFDYASARNYAATLASHDMIAMPDCDEEYTKLDLDKVIAFINGGIQQLEYNFVFSHDEHGREVIKFLHSKFYNRKCLKWVGVVHEVLSGNAQRLFVDENCIKLEHWQNPAAEHRSRYLAGLALDCYRNLDNDRNSHYLAREMMFFGRPKSAIKEFQRHVAMNKWLQERAQSISYIGNCYGMLGEEEKQLEYYHKAFALDNTRRQPLIAIADFYFRKNDFQRTACYTAAALEIPWNGFYANDKTHYEDYPHFLMYWARWYLGDREGGRYHYDKALEYAPKNSRYLHDYRFFYHLPKVSIVIPVLGREEGTKRVLASIERLNYPKELIETLVIEDSPRLGVPKRLKEGVEKSTGEWIVYAANDMEFTPDSVIQALAHSQKTKRRLIAFNAGTVKADQGNICEHFMIRRDLIPEIGGEIFDTEFNHVGVDNLLWVRALLLKENAWCELAEIRHYHFDRGFPMDETYLVAGNQVHEDRALLKKKLQELKPQHTGGHDSWPLYAELGF